MTGRVVIIGAGGFGRELLSCVQTTVWPDGKWHVAGFLDRNPEALHGFRCNCGILGDPLTYEPRHDDLLLCAIGDPRAKLQICQALRSRGARFLSLVHPTAVIGQYSEYGEGLILAPYSGVSTNVKLGNFVTVNSFSGVGHDASLGDGCTLSAHCDVTGGAVLGEGVFMGTHASVLPRVRVGDYAVVGAGSVAMRTVRARTTVLGVPARLLSSCSVERP